MSLNLVLHKDPCGRVPQRALRDLLLYLLCSREQQETSKRKLLLSRWVALVASGLVCYLAGTGWESAQQQQQQQQE